MLKFRTRIVLALSLVITAGCSTNPVKTQPSEVLAKHVTPGSDVARYLNEGVGHYARGDYERAITKYKTALVIEPTNPIALYELSLAYMSSNENEKCITTANKAWENSTEITTKLTGILGSCYSQQGNYEKAIYKQNFQSIRKSQITRFVLTTKGSPTRERGYIIRPRLRVGLPMKIRISLLCRYSLRHNHSVKPVAPPASQITAGWISLPLSYPFHGPTTKGNPKRERDSIFNPG